MTENKRFEIIKSAIIDGARVIKDNENKYTFATTFETATLINYRKALNELNDENKQLKQELKTKCIVNKQYEENQRLIKMLDNVANYMQKQHKDMPIDDFVEWWNNIATEGL